MTRLERIKAIGRNELAPGPEDGPDLAAMQACRQILRSVGDDRSRDGLIDTPYRMVKSWDELFAGYRQDPAEILKVEFEADHNQMVILREVQFFSTCEHHFLPFHGKATVAYIPRRKVVGISKLARLVECYARRLQIQERMTDQIADAVMEHLSADGAAVRVDATHLCMAARGIRKPGSIMTTTAIRGVFVDEPEARGEFIGCANRQSF